MKMQDSGLIFFIVSQTGENSLRTSLIWESLFDTWRGLAVICPILSIRKIHHITEQTRGGKGTDHTGTYTSADHMATRDKLG